MTNQQAIKIITECGLNVESAAHDEVMEKIQSALEKQIPEKGNVHGIRDGREINTVSYTCPVCHNHIGRDNYCKHCGQKLDWGDTE